MRRSSSFLPAPLTALAGVCLVATLCFASPPKLYFNKNLSRENAQRYAYQIEKGDHVYDILRRFKIPAHMRPRILERTKKLNPHIEDLDRIEPGQIVYFPDSVKKHSDFTVPEVPSFESPVPTTTYTVQPGEHLGKILRQKVRLSNRLIFDEYLALFRKLNPHIEDPDRLEVGQMITLPLPPERTRKNVALFSGNKSSRANSRPGKNKTNAEEHGTARSPGRPAARNESAGSSPKAAARPEPSPSQPMDKPKDRPEEEREHGDRSLALKILRRMGFSPSAEEKILYPSSEAGWVHIDLDRTPILETPWGSSLLLVPDQYATPLVRKKLERTDLRACRVKDSWTLTDVFQSLQESTESRLIFWSPGESLILNFSDLVLEMRGQYQFVIKTGGESKYHLFFRGPVQEREAAGLLAGYLGQKSIRIHTISDSGESRELSLVEPDSANTVDQPRFSYENLWPRVAEKLADGGDAPKSPGNRNPGTLLNYLRERDLTEKATIRLEFLDSESPSSSISLTLRATKLPLDPPAVLVPEERADPYLIGLLDLGGYAPFTLSP